MYKKVYMLNNGELRQIWNLFFEKAGSNDSVFGDNYSTNLNKVSELNEHFFELK